MRTTAIVVAAGEGRRIGGDVAKTYLPIAGPTLVPADLGPSLLDSGDKRRCSGHRAGRLRALRDVVYAVISTSFKSFLVSAKWRCDTATVRSARLCAASCGYGDRRDPRRRAAFRFSRVARACIAAAADKGAAVVGLPARDTIKFVTSDGWIQSTPESKSLWEIQTPQAFRRGRYRSGA